MVSPSSQNKSPSADWAPSRATIKPNFDFRLFKRYSVKTVKIYVDASPANHSVTTVNFTYNEQVYNEIPLVTKSNESPGRSPITLHCVLYVCNEFVYNELSVLTKPSRRPVIIVSYIFSPVVTKCCKGIPN